MSLTTCAKKAGAALDSGDKAAIMAAARKYRADGLSADEAGKQAIRDQIAAVQALMDGAVADVETGPVAEVESAAESVKAKPGVISDFGQKLEGARKDYAALMKDAQDVDIAAEPLSKSWPEPDYQKLLDGGAAPHMVAWVHASRDEIPTKPQKSWKLKGWVEGVQLLRDVSFKLLDGTISKQAMTEKLNGPGFNALRKGIGSRAELYELVGHERSLKGISFAEHYFTLYHGKENVHKWVVEQQAKATAFSNWPREVAVGDTKEEMLAQFKAKMLAAPEAAAKAKASFIIWREASEYHVGKKLGTNYVTLKKFPDVKAARAHIADHAAELDAALERYKSTPFERKTENDPRVGDDHRAGGHATPEAFDEAFKFRGVQFGNWVEQGKRQNDLDKAYDSLMDLAAVLGIPTRALSLNGQLGLAFGSQGRGGKEAAAAHYNPATVVINLTKEHGAGSLAHEWLHSVDNYFAKMDGGKGGMMTEGAVNPSVRPEMVEAFKGIQKAIMASGMRTRSRELDKRKSKPYWATYDEMAARSFEAYIIAKLQDQSAANDYLANIVSEGYWKAQEALMGHEGEASTYPYPTPAEMGPIREAFDDFFKTVETRTDDAGNVAMFDRTGTTSTANHARVTDVAETIAATWANAPEVIVVTDMQDPAVPQKIRDADATQRSQGADGSPVGFFSDGKVYLVSNQISSDQEAAEVLFHEALGHAGLRGVFGSALDKVLDQMAVMRPDPVRAKAKQYGLDFNKLSDRRQAAEEVLAELAQTRPTSTWVQRAIAVIKAWLRENVAMFKDLGMSDAEVVAAFLEPARGFIERGRGKAGGDTVFQRVWHGTPYKGIEKFDTTKIGTGEGAQAYGYGLYFASKKEVADWYREKLTPSGLVYKAHIFASGIGLMSGTRPSLSALRKAFPALANDDAALDVAYASLKSISSAASVDAALTDLRTSLEYSGPSGKKYFEDQIAWVEQNKSKLRYKPNTGQLYEVEIPEGSEMLHWDKPLSEQPKKVREALFAADFGGDGVIAAWKTNGAWNHVAGETLYRSLAGGMTYGSVAGGKSKAASDYLASIGIRGIKYLDGTSRSAGDGSYNYVIFSGDDAQIAGTMFSRRTDQTETEAFRKWFGSSVVTKDGKAGGKPLVVYHGTTGERTTFEPYWKQLERDATAAELRNGSIAEMYRLAKSEPEMHFFAAERGTAESYGPDVVEAYLKIDNMVGSPTMDRDEAIALMVESDADGAVFRDTTSSGRYGGVAYAVRKSSQVKSATGNRGTFDASNPDIRFSRTTAQASPYGDPAPEEAEAIERGLTGKTLTEATAWLADNSPPHLAIIASRALDRMKAMEAQGAKFELFIAGRGESVPAELVKARGVTVTKIGKSDGAGTFSVWLNGAAVTGKVGTSYETAIHEIVHAATISAFTMGQQPEMKGTALAQHAADLTEVTQFIHDHIRQRFADSNAGKATLTAFEQELAGQKTSALKNQNEVLAWALTNPKAQEYLEGITYKQQSAWSAFVQSVRKLLGLSPSSNSALSEVLRISDLLFDVKDDGLTGFPTLDGVNMKTQQAADILVFINDGQPVQDRSNLTYKNDGAMFSRTTGAATAGNTRQSVAAKLRNAGGGPKIIGQTGRQYTPAQLAAMSNVGFQVQAPTLEARVKALWQDAGKKLAQGLVDQFRPVRDISTHAYTLLRLSKGASGAFETLLQGGKLKLNDGVYDFDEANPGGVVETLLKPLQGEHHDALRWVAANRAERLLNEQFAVVYASGVRRYFATEQEADAAAATKPGSTVEPAGRERLFTQDDIDAIKTLADGTTAFDYTLQHGANAGTITRDRTMIYADWLKTFNAFNKNVLDMAEQSGLIDAESRAIWEHEFYVPFYRVSEDDGVTGTNVKSGVVRQQAFKQLKGGKQALNADLLENTLMNWAHLLDASAKNRAAKATLEAAEAVGAAIAAPESTAREMANSIGNKEGVVWFMDEGMKRFYMVEDPHLLTAISALEYAGMRSPMMKAMGSFKHALTIGVTASPFFKIRNLIRDSVQAIGAGQLKYNPVANVVQGWNLTDPKSDAYFRLLAGGGTIHFGTMMEGSEAKRVQALVESGVDSATILNSDKKVRAFYRKFIEPGITAYNELGNRGEAVNRASLYAQLRRQGKGHAEASLMARDLMDFSMQGSFTSIRFLSQVVPFFNARLQGMYKLGRAAKDDPARLSIVIGAAALMSVGLLAAFGDDDDWKKREDWDRNNYWWFKFGGTAFRIPKPFEIGAIATLAERGFELAFDKEMTGKRFRQQVMTLLGDNLSMNPIPQLVKPMLDVYANKDSFTGRPIETMGMDRLKADYRFTGRTSMAARGISSAANAVTGVVGAETISPVQVDHLIRGYFGWLGSFVVGAGDVLARLATGQIGKPDSDLWKTATGGIVSDLRDAPSRYVSHMYDQAAVIERAYGTWKMLKKEGKVEEAQEFREDNADLIGSYRSVNRAKAAATKINQQIRAAERSDMSGAEKRERIRELLARKDRIARTLEPA